MTKKIIKPKLISLIAILVCLLTTSSVWSQGITLQDIVNSTKPLPEVTIYTAKEVITLDTDNPSANAIAVAGDRILAVGSLDELIAAAGDQPYSVDNTFSDKVVVPGLIAQHDHPLLTALTMESEIIAIEDWVLPSGVVPAAKNQDEYRKRLIAAEAKLKDPNEQLFTWGYHPSFHGSLTRTDLDKISKTRPIIVWYRSCHEFMLNTAALKATGIDEAFVNSFSEGAKKQSDFVNGHFWEQGMFAIVPKVIPLIATPERLQNGFEFTRKYYHANGVTLACEPGGLYSKELQEAENKVFSDPSSPFRFYFIPDGKSIIALYSENTIAETKKTKSWYHGMTEMLPNSVKLFADGAIYSLTMQLREPYVGNNFHGEWIMDPDVFAKGFRIYWDAGYQIHVHVNGDAGLDMLLNNIEANMRRNPRYDHRTVVVHFAVSRKDQVDRIKELNAIVSGNPYYVTALADMYSKEGLGPERANQMVRMGDVERSGISFSFHSDMPMAPGQPLFLMDCGVNRITVSGRVAGKEQRVSREGALRSVTIEAAYSLCLEKEVGSIEPGKLANFTILADNPITCPASKIKDIAVWGTIQEGRKLPYIQNSGLGFNGPVVNENSHIGLQQMEASHHDGHNDDNCICTLNRIFGVYLAESLQEDNKQ